MKYCLTICAVALFVSTAFAQKDTLMYDGIYNIDNHAMLAVVDYPIEAEVYHTIRFTPAERCKVTHLMIAGSIVRFNTAGGNDTLVITLYDNDALPLHNIYRTWYIDMGSKGFPVPNITSGDPFGQPWHGVMVLPLDPNPIIAPARDFTLGIALKSRQWHAVGDGYYHGLNLTFIDGSPEYERYRRYQAYTNGKQNHNPVSTAARYALYARAIVEYDASLDDKDYTGVDTPGHPGDIALGQNYPNPFTGSTSVQYSLQHSGHVSLAVYDMLGRETARLAEGWMDAGDHTATFNTSGLHLAPGMYVLRLRQGSELRTRNMFLMK